MWRRRKDKENTDSSSWIITKGEKACPCMRIRGRIIQPCWLTVMLTHWQQQQLTTCCSDSGALFLPFQRKWLFTYWNMCLHKSRLTGWTIPLASCWAMTQTNFFWSQHKHMCEEYAVQQEQHTGAGGVFKIQNCSFHLPQNCFSDRLQPSLADRQTNKHIMWWIQRRWRCWLDVASQDWLSKQLPESCPSYSPNDWCTGRLTERCINKRAEYLPILGQATLS